MRVKRYLARTMAEAVALVRAEMGRDAVILQTRRVRAKGLWGLLGRRHVEVIAALDTEPKRRSPSTRRRPGPARKEEGAPGVREGLDVTIPAAPPPSNGLGTAVGGEDRLPEASSPRRGSFGVPLETAFRVPPSLRERLVALGMPAADVDTVLEEMKRAVERENVEAVMSEGSWRDVLTVTLASRIRTVEPWQLESPPCFHALIGPTGVGKTTTVAKLGANYALILQKRVGFIAADTYRIGAVDQLRRYAELLSAPLEVVRDPEEMREAVDKLAHLDLILIDTVGTSPRDTQRLASLKALLDVVPGQSHLVISATTRLPDLQELISRFSGLEPASVIVTKLDETTNPVTVFNASRLSGRPLSFLTSGQAVPEDIEVAEPEAVARAITAAIA